MKISDRVTPLLLKKPISPIPPFHQSPFSPSFKKGDPTMRLTQLYQVSFSPFQFVPFRDYMYNGQYNPLSGVRLAKDVLHELPDQVIEYMEKRKIKPQAPPPYIP